jgi:hypothetical protein
VKVHVFITSALDGGEWSAYYKLTDLRKMCRFHNGIFLQVANPDIIEGMRIIRLGLMVKTNKPLAPGV